MKKTFMMLLAVVMCAVMVSGCYGPFRLTKKLFQWNGSVGDKWTNEAVFLVLNILPVYGLVVAGDAVVFNSIEFWTGNNPLAVNSEKRSKMITQGDKQTVFTLASAEQKLRVDMFDHYRPSDYFTIERADSGMTVARNSKGEVIASAVTTEQGEIVLK